MRLFKYLFILISLIISNFSLKSQNYTPPYINYFVTLGDSLNWTHYAVSGTDSWEYGTPTYAPFNKPHSYPYAWEIDLDTWPQSVSNIALESPYFNLQDTTVNYVLSFQQMRALNPGEYFYTEYSLDKGMSWLLLYNVGSMNKNWQATTGFSGHTSSEYIESTMSLRFIQGQDSVKFRFRHNITLSISTNMGWAIDDFSIQEEYYNIWATKGDTMYFSQKCGNVEVSSFLGFHNPYGVNTPITTKYYLSLDTILDLSDSLLATNNTSINDNDNDFNYIVPLPTNINTGTYYIIYEHDVNNVVNESNENDNISFSVLTIDSVFALPYIVDFENNDKEWTTYHQTPFTPTSWTLGEGYTHFLEHSHSGTHSWHTCSNIYSQIPLKHYLQSGFIDLTSATGNLVINVWSKTYTGGLSIDYSDDCGISWGNVFSSTVGSSESDWWFTNININPAYLTNNNFQIRFVYTQSGNKEGVGIDDFYLGLVKPDLSIEYDKDNRYLQSNSTIDSLKYLLVNCGRAAALNSYTSFYWSNDTIFDGNDIYLGANTEITFNDTGRTWSTFSFTKPTTAQGKYYIFYMLDTTNVVDEMRESNNFGYFTLYQDAPKNAPYFNDFETQIDGWRHNSSLGGDDWQWGTPNGTLIDSAFSGTKALITNDTGTVVAMSEMHLYSPVFNISTLSRPILEFNMWNYAKGGNYNSSKAGSNLEYSVDGGAIWQTLKKANNSVKGIYYFMEFSNLVGKDFDYLGGYSTYIMNSKFSDINLVSTDDYQSRDNKKVTNHIMDITHLKSYNSLQFRFNVSTGFTPNEGLMIDDFSITDSTIDLSVENKRPLMFSSLSPDFKFYMDINNSGNCISQATTNKFYLSVDSILDISDILLGTNNLPEIRPDRSLQINEIFPIPSNILNYNYLIYELDIINANNETNETNNVGFWPLALDSIDTFPYIMDFNESPVVGWHNYAFNYQGTHIKDAWRFRNNLVPAEPIYTTLKVENQMYTELYNVTMNYNKVPYMYLEAPAFDFSNTTPIHLSFDLFCVGVNASDGGNFQYSTDGGLTWTVLTSSHGATYNWYNYNKLTNMNNEPGWTFSGAIAKLGVGGADTIILDSAFIDLTFLSGSPNVLLRFQFRSKQERGGGLARSGLRIDNFKIDGVTTVDIPEHTKLNVTFYPNPLGETSTLYLNNSNNQITNIKIFNSVGQLIKTIKTSNSQVNFFKKDFDSGLYIININNQSGSSNIKFLVNK